MAGKRKPPRPTCSICGFDNPRIEYRGILLCAFCGATETELNSHGMRRLAATLEHYGLKEDAEAKIRLARWQERVRDEPRTH